MHTLRQKNIVLPGLIAFVLAVLTHLVAAALQLQFSVVQIAPVVFTVQFAWLACLVLIGAFGAYYAATLGAMPAQRLAAAVFPALMSGWLVMIGAAITLLANSEMPFDARVISSLIMLMGWVVAPGLALAAGAIPFVAGAGYANLSRQ